MRINWPALTLAWALSGAAAAEPPTVLNEAFCPERPSFHDEISARAKAGVQEGVRGEVHLRCALNPQHVLKDCQVLSETPDGNHFAAAALLLSRKYECEVTRAKGGPVQIELSYVFDRVLPDTGGNGGREPDYDLLRPAFPVAAVKAHINGAAVVECGITAEGLLAQCKIIAEAPEHLGFGSSALVVAPGFRFDPPTRRGKPIPDGTTRFVLSFPANGVGAYTKAELEPVAPMVYWDQTPTRSDILSAFPAEARGKAHSGRVVFRCGFKNDGALGKCDVLDVSGYGGNFTAAARSLLPRFRMAVGSVDSSLLPELKVNLVVNLRDGVQDTPPADITQPEWMRTLSSNRMQEVFPPKAADAGLNTGRAALDCIADTHGMMSGCVVTEETPADMGFGPAVLRVVTVMGINPWTADGDPVEGSHVKFAIRLNRADDPPPAAASSPPPAKP